jgi:hypothetical protein
MINFLQLNQNLTEWSNYIIHSGVWSKLHTMLLGERQNEEGTQASEDCPDNTIDDGRTPERGTSAVVKGLSGDDLLSKDNIQRYIHQISIQYNMDKRQIIQSYFDYIIRMRSHILSGEFLNIMEDCLHNYDTDIENLIAFFYYKLHNYYKNI